MNIDVKRIAASIDGAVIAFMAYLVVLIVLSVFAYDYHTLPNWLSFLISPWENIINFAQTTANIAGMPPTMAIANIGTYTMIGYMIDWIKDPYK